MPPLLFNSLPLQCYCQRIHETGESSWWTGFCFLSHYLPDSFITPLDHTPGLQAVECPSTLFQTFISKQHCLPQSPPHVNIYDCSKTSTTDCIPKCDRHVRTYIHCKNRFLIQSFTLICSAVMNSIYWKLVQLAQTKIVWPKQCHAHEHACVVVLCRRDSSACMCAGIRFWRWSERACFVDLQPTEASPCLTTSRQTNIVLVVKMLCA